MSCSPHLSEQKPQAQNHQSCYNTNALICELEVQDKKCICLFNEITMILCSYQHIFSKSQVWSWGSAHQIFFKSLWNKIIVIIFFRFRFRKNIYSSVTVSSLSLTTNIYTHTHTHIYIYIYIYIYISVCMYTVCPTLYSPVDCSLPGSSVYGILQARMLECISMPSSRGSSRLRDWTCVSSISCTAGFFTHWASMQEMRVTKSWTWLSN